MKRRVAVGTGLLVFLAGGVAQYFLHFVEPAGKGLARAGNALNDIRPGGLSLTLWIALALALVLGSVWVRSRRRIREQPCSTPKSSGCFRPCCLQCLAAPPCVVLRAWYTGGGKLRFTGGG